MENDTQSGVNTVLLVIILLIVVGVLVWFFRGSLLAEPQEEGFEVDVNLSGEQTAE